MRNLPPFRRISIVRKVRKSSEPRPVHFVLSLSPKTMGLDHKPGAVIPENLSEMSPVLAWNLALKTIGPLAEYNSFWNDGLDTSFDIEQLLVPEEKTDAQERKIRFRNGPRRMVSRHARLHSWGL